MGFSTEIVKQKRKMVVRFFAFNGVRDVHPRQGGRVQGTVAPLPRRAILVQIHDWFFEQPSFLFEIIRFSNHVFFDVQLPSA